MPSSVTVKSAVDDLVNVFVNNYLIPECRADLDHAPVICNVENHLKIGENTIVFKVTDHGGAAGLAFIITFTK